MELNLIDSFGKVDKKVAILSNEEYAYITGSQVMVRQFKTLHERNYKFLRSDFTDFCVIEYNSTTSILAVCESGRNSQIKIYNYSKDKGFEQLAQTTVSKALEVSVLSLSYDGTRLAVLIPEPLQMLKIYEFQEKKSLKEIISISLEEDYTQCKISPNNKNFICLMNNKKLSVIELKESFPENYDTHMGLDMPVGDSKPMWDFNQLKSTEESELQKRHDSKSKSCENEEEFVEFVWDSYNNIYVGTDMGMVYLYDVNLIKITIMFQNEPKDPLRMNAAVTSLLLTQRFLIVATDDCKISMINIYIPENEIAQYKPSIGNPENYRMMEVEKEFSVLDGEVITFMKYDPKFSKLLVGTENNSFYLILLTAEILVREKEKDEMSENNNIISQDIDHFEECKFHTDKIIGLRELGTSSQFITIGFDRNIIIWELSDRNVKTLYSVDYTPISFEVDNEGDLLFTGSKEGVFRVYDITNRSSIRLINQIKFSDESIDKIVYGSAPLGGNNVPFLTLFKKGSNTIFFASGEALKSFIFLGYINTPYPIIDICFNPGNTNYAEILVLIKQMILSYEIPKFHYDHKIATEIKEKKEKDIFLNFELNYELKARKCDSDLKMIFKQGKTEFVWLCGSDKYLRIYNMPNENFEALRENKRSPENPLDEIRGHDLEITTGICNDILLITGGFDGKIQIRKDRTVYKQFRSHSYLKNGISAVFYSSNRKLVYACGFDGSIFIFSDLDTTEIPNEPVNNSSQNEAIEVFDTMEEFDDAEVKRFKELIVEEHNRLIKLAKKTSQAVLKTKLDEIRAELNKYLRENSDLDEIEKLKLDEMIIDLNRILKEKEKGKVECDKMIKNCFEELCELEILKEKLFEKTYNSMILKEEVSGGQVRYTNNNIRMTSSTNGEKILKSYPIRNFSEGENSRIIYVKQLRLIEINEKYKRKSEKIHEVLDESNFSIMNEDYILNRIPSKITLVETEIKPSEIMDVQEGDFTSREKDGGRQYKIAKYKLQREPYENENVKNMKNENDNIDQANFRPDEQLLKEDLSIKYKTIISKPIDIEFIKNLADIDSFNLLYSPFELYTNFRKRNQIYLIIDIIQGLKQTFNKEFKQFLVDKNALLEKFNTNKQAIENIRELLGDHPIENYNYAINPHEDNEWIKKVEEGEIKVPKYFSKDEKMRLEEERKIEEERLKALQGDTLEMRGLVHMIEQKSTKTKKIVVEEQELIKEQFMDKKKKEEWTEEEIRKFNEYQKKEKEINDRKEKIKSQNLTKLNNHRMDIENIKSDLDSKFLKIFKKKLYYDYKITEQELCILALLRTMDYRKEIKKKVLSANETYEKLKDLEEISRRNFLNFETNYNRLNEKKKEIEDKYIFANKAPGKVVEQLEKSLVESLSELTTNEKDILYKIRNDPFFFVERDKFKYNKKYGNKGYREIKNPVKTNDENLVLLNRRYYYQYKFDQFITHKNYLANELFNYESSKAKCQNELRDLQEELKKSKLNFDILIKIKKGQDEITDEKGPQEHIDECLLIDHTKIENINKQINQFYTQQYSFLTKVNAHKEIESYMNLDCQRINLEKHEIELKLRYLRLTRVTKKIQEVVTGREDIDQAQISNIYDQKKKNLDENKKKREQIMEKKIKELKSEIDKKKKENFEFSIKLKKLMENVTLKEQIIMLDSEDKDQEEVQDAKDVNNKNNKKKYKNFLEIARVTKLKNLVQQYYEEIEYLRTELDKLRARTFPSFLQKPDNILYPDEK